jgi:hypothetical protein
MVTECIDCKVPLENADELDQSVEETPDNETAYNAKKIKTGKYPILRFISSFYAFLAAIIGIGVVIGLIALLSNGANDQAIPYLFGGVIGVVTLLAFSEIIRVFLDIEENTRMSKNV